VIIEDKSAREETTISLSAAVGHSRGKSNC